VRAKGGKNAQRGQSCYLPLWLFSAYTLDFTYFKRLAKLPSLCMDKVAGEEATWLPKAAGPGGHNNKHPLHP
jgi:hypothetical protein